MLSVLADLPLSFITALAFIFGLAFGSFLNVVIHRLPLGQNPAWPASHCPACQTSLAWRDNIPLLSFIWLRRQCSHCAAPIAWRYPLVELLTAVVWAGLAWHYGAAWQLLWALGLSLFLIALAFIDAEHQLLPDVLTYPLLLFGFAASIARQLFSQSNVTFDIFFTDPTVGFVRWKVALYGALWLACAAPLLFALDWLDGWLFDHYFDEEEPDNVLQHPVLDEGENRLVMVEQDNILLHSHQAQLHEALKLAQPIDAATAAREEAIDAACAEQRYRVVTTAFAVGLAFAAIWALWMALDRKTSVTTLSRAYEGITDAVFGAFIAGGIIWMLRAVYFWLRKAEGMGLGDVKMMAGVGAYLGWVASFGVLLYGSILGAVFGLAIALRGADRWKTLLPFGTCLAFAALLVLLQA